MEFDPTDEECWNFGSITRTATNEVLMNSRQEVGVFLIRNCSSHPGDFVLCVRDEQVVRQYRIYARKRSAQVTTFTLGEQDFLNMASLLNYFHDNAIDANSSLILKRPACMRIPIKRSKSMESVDSGRSSMGNGLTLPAFAFVKTDRIPNAYDTNALTLHEGDLVKVTKIHVNGIAEGVCEGRFGKFPFHLLEFVDQSL